MGQFGFSRVEIAFKESIPLALTSKTAMEQSIDKGLSINDFKQLDKAISFELSSVRLPNLQYQVMQVVKYIVDNKIKVESVNSSSYASSDYGAFEYDGDGELDEEYLLNLW
jgi:hypothetical protein